MKKSVITLFFLLSILSCEKGIIEYQDNQFAETRIQLMGDYVEFSTEPLSKSNANETYYAFEVDSVCVQEGDTSFVHYADGVFTNIEHLSINLEKGHKYRIRCDIIQNRQDIFYVDNDNCVYQPFVDPTERNYGTKAQITNCFTYGRDKEVFLKNPSHGMIRNNRTSADSYVKMCRFYGETITPEIEDNQSLSLNLKRLNIGVHIIITPPKEGELRVFCYGNPNFYYTVKSKGASINEEFLYTLSINEEKCVGKLFVRWVKNDKETIDLSPGERVFYRNTMTTIMVDVNERAGNNDIDINLDSDMTQDEIVVKSNISR